MSLGRLSPQGAMMMFEAPYIGVSVPRGVPGRGTAVDDDGLFDLDRAKLKSPQDASMISGHPERRCPQLIERLDHNLLVALLA